jgi:hypothetical protein
MTDKLLAAAFYLPPGRPVGSLATLLASAGADDIGAASPGDRSGLRRCRWAGMTCRAYLSTASAAPVLVIYFPQASFLELLGRSGADDLLASFEHACEALQPDAALIVTHQDQAELTRLEHLGGGVAEADAPSLAAGHFGLLYVSDKLADYQTGPWIGTNREVIPTVSGRLIFGGEGTNRWW